MVLVQSGFVQLSLYVFLFGCFVMCVVTYFSKLLFIFPISPYEVGGVGFVAPWLCIRGDTFLSACSNKVVNDVLHCSSCSCCCVVRSCSVLNCVRVVCNWFKVVVSRCWMNLFTSLGCFELTPCLGWMYRGGILRPKSWLIPHETPATRKTKQTPHKYHLT